MKEERVEFDGINDKVKGIFFYPERENPPAVLMVQSYTDDTFRLFWENAARHICENGFAVLRFQFTAYNTLPDMRDVGIKDEIEELKLAINFMEKSDVDENRIGIFSLCLGSSVACLLNDSRIKTYVMLNFIKKLKYVFSNFVFDKDTIENIEKNGFCKRKSITKGKERTIGDKFWKELKEMDEIKEEQIKGVNGQCLFISGSKDNYTTVEEIKDFYNIFNNPKKLFLVEGANHNEILFDYKDSVLKETINWFNRWLK